MDANKWLLSLKSPRQDEAGDTAIWKSTQDDSDLDSKTNQRVSLCKRVASISH